MHCRWWVYRKRRIVLSLLWTIIIIQQLSMSKTNRTWQVQAIHSLANRRQRQQQPPQKKGARVSVVDCIKTAIAGGIAGAVGTATLYPLDAAKTLRQASPDTYRSVRTALKHLIQTKAVYRGAWTAIIGAIPSSALYFGAYETAKRCLLAAAAQAAHQANVGSAADPPSLARPHNFGKRLLLHSAAAASGNLVSSAVFVPKELVKQRLQYCSTPSCTWLTVISDIIHDKGVIGLYTGYLATVLRNVPSAALRFGLYEELKRSWTAASNEERPLLQWRLFAAGAVAGAIASGIMTPIDVLKTRVSTGTCPVDLPSCMQQIVKVDGWSALFAGAGSRMAASAAFSSIGFGTFEAAKRILRIPPLDVDLGSTAPTSKHVSHDYCPRPVLHDPKQRYCQLVYLRLPPYPATLHPRISTTTFD